MEKISFDSGIKEYRINDKGVLRFYPADPNLYARFLEAAEKIQRIEQDLTEQAKQINEEDTGTAAVKLMVEADKQMKAVLSWVFGADNDFDKILNGVNLLAVAANGERVVTNFFAALQPVLVAGAEACAKQTAQSAVEQAKARRAAR